MNTKREDYIDDILKSLVNSGSIFDENKHELETLKKYALDVTKKDRGLDEVLSSIASDIERDTKIFLSKKSEFDMPFISGIFTGL